MRIKRSLTILLTVAMIVVLSPSIARAATAYEANDFSKLQTFLNQPSAIAGKTNGQQISDNYDANDPTTWTGVLWNDASPKRVISINSKYSDWRFKSLSGALDLSGCTKLEWIYCYNNELTSLNVSGATALIGLYCSDNNLTSINVSGATALTAFDCGNNRLTSLDLSNVPMLVKLECTENQISSLDISNNNKVERLYCAYNQLTSLNISNATLLEDFYCQDNRLTSLDVSGSPKLQYLECSNNLLKTLYVGTDSKLESINCHDNQLTTLDLNGAIGLVSLDCSENLLTTLNIKGLIYLNSFFCNDNQLTTLDATDSEDIYYFNASSNQLVSILGTVRGTDITLAAVGKGYVELIAYIYPTLYSNESFYESGGEEFDLLAVPQPGASFIEWTKDGAHFSDSEGLYNINERKIDLVAHFTDDSEIIKHTVTFDLNGGTRTGGGALSQEIVQGESAIAPTAIRSGFDFAGWNVTLNNVMENITVTAIWTPVVSVIPEAPVIPAIPSYTVVFDINGGTHTGGGALIQYILNEKPALEPTVNRVGFTFKGWNEKFDSITKNLIVKANWEEVIVNHTVTFDLYGGKHTGGGELIQEVKEGGGAVVPTATLDGYLLVGWDKDFENVMEDITITADWKEIPSIPEQSKYTITYDANGGDGTVPVDRNEYAEGDSVILEDGSGLLKHGFHFDGWSLTKDGDAISSTDVFVYDDATFYAVWSAEEPTEELLEDTIPKTGVLSTAYLGIFMLLCGAGILLVERIQKRNLAKH